MLRYLTTAALLLFVLTSQAQQPGSGGPTPGSVTGAPIDGGVSILLASGAAYAVRHLRQRRRK